MEKDSEWNKEGERGWSRENKAQTEGGIFGLKKNV